MTAPEFSRLLRIEQIGELPRTEALAADADERAALAARFGLIAVERLTASASVRREAETVVAEGMLDAAIVQACVATGEPLPATLHAPFRLRFEPSAESGEDVELAESDLDIVPYTGGEIDLGEAVAETLALALDPFPRAPDADSALRAAGVIGEEEAGPFAGLRTLRDQLGKPS